LSVGNCEIAVRPRTRIVNARKITACGFLSAALTIGCFSSKAAASPVYYKIIWCCACSFRAAGKFCWILEARDSDDFQGLGHRRIDVEHVDEVVDLCAEA